MNLAGCREYVISQLAYMLAKIGDECLCLGLTEAQPELEMDGFLRCAEAIPKSFPPTAPSQLPAKSLRPNGLQPNLHS